MIRNNGFLFWVCIYVYSKFQNLSVLLTHGIYFAPYTAMSLFLCIICCLLFNIFNCFFLFFFYYCCSNIDVKGNMCRSVWNWASGFLIWNFIQMLIVLSFPNGRSVGYIQRYQFLICISKIHFESWIITPLIRWPEN